MRHLLPLLALVPAPVLAASFERPVPEARRPAPPRFPSRSPPLALVLTLGAAQWLVGRR